MLVAGRQVLTTLAGLFVTVGCVAQSVSLFARARPVPTVQRFQRSQRQHRPVVLLVFSVHAGSDAETVRLGEEIAKWYAIRVCVSAG
jgi:hypothetical protein